MVAGTRLIVGYKHTLTICNTYCFSTATMVAGTRLIVGYKHTLTICNTHCFSTATMVAGTRLIVMLYVQCMSYLPFPSVPTFLFSVFTRLLVAVCIISLRNRTLKESRKPWKFASRSGYLAGRPWHIKRLVCSEFQCHIRNGLKCIHNYGNAVWPLADPVAPDRSSQLVGPVMRFLWVRTKSNLKITKEKVVGLVVWTRNNTASSLQAVSSLRIATKTHLSLGADPSCRMRQ